MLSNFKCHALNQYNMKTFWLLYHILIYSTPGYHWLIPVGKRDVTPFFKHIGPPYRLCIISLSTARLSLFFLISTLDLAQCLAHSRYSMKIYWIELYLTAAMIQHRGWAVAWEWNPHCLNFPVDLPVNDWQQHNPMPVFGIY